MCGKNNVSKASIRKQRCLRMCVYYREREVTGSWRKVPYKELRNFNFSPNYQGSQFRRDEIGRACRMHERDKFTQSLSHKRKGGGTL